MVETLVEDIGLGPGNNWYRYDEQNKTWVPITEDEFWSRLKTEMDKIIGEAKTDPEIRNKLQQTFGQDPRLLDLIQRRDDSYLIYWPNAQDILRNYRSADEPTDQIDQIDSSNSQGIGPPPPSTSPDTMTTNQDNLESNNAKEVTRPSRYANSKTGGDPLILFSGQLYYQVTDLEVNGRGLHFAFKRTYLHQTLYKGPLGYSWDHSYNLWLREQSEVQPDGTLQNVVYRSTGQLREDKYIQIFNNPTGGPPPPLTAFQDAVFRSPVGFFDRLEKSNGRYILEMTTGVRFEYNSDLLIERIVDPNGNEMIFKYTEQLLTEIHDPVGKKFLLDYDSMNRIKSLYDVTSKRKVRYNYGDNGDLEEVDLDLKPYVTGGTDYRYLGPDYPSDIQHNLIEIIGPNGRSQLENEYGTYPGTWEYNRVIGQLSGDGEYVYEYGGISETPVDPALDPINVPVNFTRVFYPNCHVAEYWFNAQGNVLRRAEKIIGSTGTLQELVTSYRYNEDSLLIEERRADGSMTEYRYQREAYAELHGGDVSGATPAERLGFGNMLRKVDSPKAGSGEIRRIVTEFMYHPFGNRLAKQKGPYYADTRLNPLPGQKTIAEIFYDYDSRGNLEKIRYPTVKRPDGSTQQVASPIFKYNRYGLISDVIVDSAHTKYEYFSDVLRSGFVNRKIEDVNGANLRTSYQVDSIGRIVQIVDHYGSITNIEWTSFDTPQRIILPGVLIGAGSSSRPSIFYKYDRSHQVTQSKEEIILHDGSAHPDRSIIKAFRYDSYGRIIQQSTRPESDPHARTNRTVFTSFGLVKKEIDALGGITITKYNERMLPSEIINGAGTTDQRSRLFYYNEVGDLAYIVDGTGFKTSIKYDGFGRVHTITDPDGNEKENEYDAAGRVIVNRLYGIHPETGNNRVRWSEIDYRYDAAGRLNERIDHLFVPSTTAAGPDILLSTQYLYDPLNRVETIVDAAGRKWNFQYDGLGRLLEQLDPNGNRREWRYDDAARTVITIEEDVGLDESGNSIRQFFKSSVKFDERGLAVEDIDSLKNIRRSGFDSRRLRTYFVDHNGQEFFVDYNVYGEPVSYKTRLSSNNLVRKEMAYDDNGRVIHIISPIQGQTRFVYDSLGRIISVERKDDGDSKFDKYTYDKEDNLIRHLDGSGIQLKRSYTPGGLLSSIQPDTTNFLPPADVPNYEPSPTSGSQFKYTPAGMMAFAQNKGSTLVFRYDSLDRVIQENINGRSIGYSYDALGYRTAMTYPNRRSISFDYLVGAGLMSILQNSAGSPYPGDVREPKRRILLSVWRVGDRPIAIKFGKSHIAKISYDSGKRIVGIDWNATQSGASILQERNLFGSKTEWMIYKSQKELRVSDFDELSRLIKVEDYSRSNTLIDIARIGPPRTEGGLATAASQNEIDNLIASIKRSVGATVPSVSILFNLDSNDNRAQVKQRRRSGGSGTRAPLTTSTRYVVDRQDRYHYVGSKRVYYDNAGNMIGDGVQTYRYDAYNNLSELRNPSGVTKLVRDALHRLIKIQNPDRSIDELTYAGSSVIEWIKNGKLDGQAIPMDRPNQIAHVASVGMDSTPLFNIMDSIIGWMTPAGKVRGRIYYDSFGQIIRQTGRTSVSKFGFAGYLYNEHSKTYQLPARTYHPYLGRFLQRDPLGFIDGTNLYAYAHHAPGSLTDYWGLMASDISWSEVAVKTLKKIGKGILVIGGITAAVTGGVPFAFILTLSGVLAATAGINSYITRANEAIAAGMTDFRAKTALAAMGDVVGLTNIYEAITRRRAVTRRPLTREELTESMSSVFSSGGLSIGGSIVGKMGASSFAGPKTGKFYSDVVREVDVHSDVKYANRTIAEWEERGLRSPSIGGTEYHKMVADVMRKQIGRTLEGGWKLVAVEAKMASGRRVDALYVNEKAQKYYIEDVFTGKSPDPRHLAKTWSYTKEFTDLINKSYTPLAADAWRPLINASDSLH
jgi:RHS repeat-associated protein